MSEFAQIRHDMWLDDEWRALTPAAQHLYLLVLSDPQLSYAGVTAFKPAAMANRAAEWSVMALMGSAIELSYAFFLVFDQDTEEVLVRSYLRHDSLMKNPRLAVSMAKAFGTIGSNKIRAAIVHELIRLKKEQPDLGAWDKPQVKTVLRQTAFSAKDLPVDLDMPLGMDLPVAFAKAEGSVYQPPTTATATTTTTPTPSKEVAVPKSSVTLPPSSREAKESVCTHGRPVGQCQLCEEDAMAVAS